jgi:hypothetical protein
VKFGIGQVKRLQLRLRYSTDGARLPMKVINRESTLLLSSSVMTALPLIFVKVPLIRLEARETSVRDGEENHQIID